MEDDEEAACCVGERLTHEACRWFSLEGLGIYNYNLIYLTFQFEITSCINQLKVITNKIVSI